jgi:hypothetical protein
MNAPSFIDLDNRAVLDLRHVHFSGISNGILVMGTWYIEPDTRQAEPCMVLMDPRKRRRKAIPCVIRLSDMWAWTREMGDAQFVAAEVGAWMRSGALPGNPANKADAFKILDAVHSRLRDVWSMPPLPPAAAIKHGAVPIGSMSIIEGETGKVLNEIEVVSANVRS